MRARSQGKKKNKKGDILTLPRKSHGKESRKLAKRGVIDEGSRQVLSSEVTKEKGKDEKESYMWDRLSPKSAVSRGRVRWGCCWKWHEYFSHTCLSVGGFHQE